MKTLGADKGYYTKALVEVLRKRRNTPGLDGRTSRHENFRVSQRNRKRIEDLRLDEDHRRTRTVP